VVRQIVGLAQIAKRSGANNLEKQASLEGFLGQGLKMVVDRIDREHIEDRLLREIHATQERHAQGQEIFRFVATAAPSFGMVGTLIGMVQLFATLKDPTGVGGAMALSLLSTLYGAVIAYLFAIPVAGKLELRSREEMQMKRLMMEGVMGIQAEMNPALLESQLNASLAPAKQVRLHAGSR
jgi:chemotaxis protein MotA